MEEVKFKNLGSIVKVKGGDKRFMITGRAISVTMKKGEKPKLFDYSAVLYPEGAGLKPVFFQDSDISEVIFAGFSDKDDESLIKLVNDYLKTANPERATKEDYIRKPGK